MRDATRRDFLVRVALGAGGGVALLYLPLGCGPPIAIDLSNVFASPGDAAATGKRYLERFPDERDVHALQAPLLAGIDDPSDPVALRAALAKKIRDDFAERRTFRDGDWWLSRSEARLCALAALE